MRRAAQQRVAADKRGRSAGCARLPLPLAAERWYVRRTTPMKPRHVVLALAVAAASTSCTSKTQLPLVNYFSEAPLAPRPVIDRELRTSFGETLIAMHEPPLPGRSGRGYRFLYVRDFHHPRVVRVEATNGGYQIRAAGRVGDGATAYWREYTRPLTESEWSTIVASLTAAEFWKLPTDLGDAELDGSEWVLEGFDAGRYHLVHCWSPGPGPFLDACKAFLKTGGFSLDELY